MRYIIPLALVLCVLGAPARADEVLEETWQRVHLGGSPAGITHVVVRKVDAEGGPRIETRSRSEMSINRMGSILEIVSEEVTWEALDGTLLRTEGTTTMSGQEQSAVYVFEGTTVKVATTVLGQTRNSELEVPEGVLGPYAIQKRSSVLAGTTGEVVEVLMFMGDMGAAAVATSTSKGMEAVALVDGTTVELTRVESTIEGLPMKPISWLDADGQARKTQMTLAGMLFETWWAESEEAARRAPTTGPTESTDVFRASLLHEPGPVPVPRHLEEATIVMRRVKADAVLPEITSASHRVTPIDGDTWMIHATRYVPAEGVAAARPLADPPADLADALAPSSMIQSDAPEIRDLAERIVGGEADAWRAAQTLERWVFVNLKNKGFGVAFASALEVCRNLEGDCTEHAVLLAALCRAAGIPARVVMGYEYLMGIWGGHAWNEVRIDGGWYPLDATNGFGFADPLHLPMAHMTLKEGGFAQEFAGLLGGMGNLELDVIQVVHEGRRVAVNDDALITTEGSRYTNRVWGLELEAPEGFRFAPPSGRGISARLMTLEGTTSSGATCEIEINALDAPPTADWPTVLKSVGLEASDVREAEIDGRSARRQTRTSGGQARERLLVVAGDALFLIEMDRVEGEAERKALETMVESIDFDVR